MTVTRNLRAAGATVALFLVVVFCGAAWAQQQPAPAPLPPIETLTPDQLDDLVAPVALYPDPLLSQLLVAATYPLEVVQAYQWLQKNPGLTGPPLTQAAQQQSWDASVQALVMFPDVLKNLNDDVSWTTALGNAFLAQQSDVMDAVQRMRQKAQQAGDLQSTPQEDIVADNGAIDIVPVDPDLLYVPLYDPAWIWGSAQWYPYPHWYWPPRTILRGGLFFGFGPGINARLFFGGGWHGWGGWGWRPGWSNHAVTVNNTFIHQYNFNGPRGAAAHGTTTWTHDPARRMGVPYASPAVSNRFRANVQQALAPRAIPEAARQPGERFGNRQMPHNVTPQENRGLFSGMQNGAAARTHAEHGFSSLGPARSAPAMQAASATRGGPGPARSAPAMHAAPAGRGGGGRR